MQITCVHMGTTDFSSVLDKIIRLTTEHTISNAASVLPVIENLKACVSGQMNYNGYLCFDAEGVKLVTAEPMRSEQISEHYFEIHAFEDVPQGHSEVWRIEVNCSVSDTPRFVLGHMYSRTAPESPKDRFLRMIYDRSIKVSTVKEPHTYMRAVGTKEIERILERM